MVRKGNKAVPLVLVDEHLEEEAHELAFNTGFDPQMVVLRDGRRRDKGMDFTGGREGYAKIDGAGFVNSDGSCRLTVGADGRAAVTLVPPGSIH